MKRLISFKLVLVGFILNCCTVSNDNDKTKVSSADTILYSNGYKVIIGQNNELKNIINCIKSDTLNLSFNNNSLNVLISNENRRIKYYFSERKGLYKLKYYMSPIDYNFYQNQIIYFDTLASNFLIKENSDYIDLKGLKDTFLLNEMPKINIRLFDSVFTNFNIYIKNPNDILDFKKNNLILKQSFYNKKGCSYILNPNSKGTYYFQGFIENCMPSKDSINPSRIYFFKKKIYIK